MDERARVGAFMLAGAAIGGVLGFLFFTDGGRRVRAEIGPKLEDLVEGARELGTHLRAVRDVAADGWQTVSQLVTDRAGDDTAWPGPRPATH